MTSKRKWSLRRVQPTKRVESLRRRKLVTERQAATPSGPFAGGSVLPTIEEFIARLLGLLVGTLGSLTLGVVALCRRRPAVLLNELEHAGRALPWGTVVLLTSTLFGVWLVDGPRGDSARILVNAIDQENVAYRYLDCVLPALAIGLGLSGVGWLQGNHASGAQGGQRWRLLTATVYGLALLSACAAMTAPPGFTDSDIPVMVKALGYSMYGVCLLVGRITWVSLPLSGLASRSVAGVCRIGLAVTATNFALQFVIATRTISLNAAPFLTDYGLWPSLSEQPEGRMVFQPKSIPCSRLSQGPAHHGVHAAGRSRARIAQLLPKPLRCFRMAHTTKQRLSSAADWRLKSELAGTRFIAPTPKDIANVVVLESGKPLIVEVKLNLREACFSLKARLGTHKLFVSLERADSWLILPVHFGPWHLSMNDWYCNPPSPFPPSKLKTPRLPKPPMTQ